jgi:hypothetical protein
MRFLRGARQRAHGRFLHRKVPLSCAFLKNTRLTIFVVCHGRRTTKKKQQTTAHLRQRPTSPGDGVQHCLPCAGVETHGKQNKKRKNQHRAGPAVGRPPPRRSRPPATTPSGTHCRGRHPWPGSAPAGSVPPHGWSPPLRHYPPVRKRKGRRLPVRERKGRRLPSLSAGVGGEGTAGRGGILGGGILAAAGSWGRRLPRPGARVDASQGRELGRQARAAASRG